MTPQAGCCSTTQYYSPMFMATVVGLHVVLCPFKYCLTHPTDYRSRKKLGELSTTVFALGLHQEPDNTVPFFLQEIRERIMIASYSMDKEHATFLGRPPSLAGDTAVFSSPWTSVQLRRDFR